MWGSGLQEVQLAECPVRDTEFCSGSLCELCIDIVTLYDQLASVGSTLRLDLWFKNSHFKGKLDTCRQEHSSRYIGKKNIMNEMGSLAKDVEKQMGDI